MKDMIRTTAITSAMMLTAISPMSTSAKAMITPNTSASASSISNALYDTADGSVGRLTIGGYTAELYTGSSQTIVDAADSAAYIPWGNIVMIADHAFQGFDVLYSCGAGSTATITDNSTVTYLTCASTYQGNNSGNGIDLADGRYAEQVSDGSYILYTCNDAAGVSVTVTYWNVTGTAAAAQAVTETASVEESTAEAPTATIDAALTETQSVVDTTVTAPTQQTQDQTTAQALNAAASVPTETATNTSVPEFAEKTTDSYNMPSANFGSKFLSLLTANKQKASETGNTLRTDVDNLMYYADNRRWLALANKQDDSIIAA